MGVGWLVAALPSHASRAVLNSTPSPPTLTHHRIHPFTPKHTHLPQHHQQHHQQQQQSLAEYLGVELGELFDAAGALPADFLAEGDDARARWRQRGVGVGGRGTRLFLREVGVGGGGSWPGRRACSAVVCFKARRSTHHHHTPRTPMHTPTQLHTTLMITWDHLG